MSDETGRATALSRTGEDKPETAEIVGGTIKLTFADLGSVLLLILFGLVPLGFAWHFLTQRTFDSKQFSLFVLLGLFAFCIIETFAILLLAGLQRLSLPTSTLKWLGAATIGEVAGLLALVLKFLT